MKLVREHIIFEKFTEESDPIDDMGIGLIHRLRQEYKKAYAWRSYLPDNEITLEELLDFIIWRTDNNIVEAEILIHKGANLNDKKYYFLRSAVRKGEDYVKLFLDNGADPKLHVSESFVDACASGKIKIAKMLLDAGANLHANGDIALRKAVIWGGDDIAKWLMEKGAYCKSKDYYALREALKRKNYELADLFVKQYIKDRNL
jgi:ankyrin repeat protein